MSVKIYNTRTRKKEEFTPYAPPKVNLYACGPTVYNYAHIGNLRMYIFEDVLVKALRKNGYGVKHVMNITDVGHLSSDGDTGDDKMSLGAKREQKTVWEIAQFYEHAFFEDAQKLNITRPDVVCRATEHINDMIAFIQGLEEKGFTYMANGNVYFSIDKFPDYAKFADLKMADLDAGNRIQVDAHKKNPFDFVLWFTNSKFENQIMQWDSPWGRGFPGWHIECSVMSIRYLGPHLDIHCGGTDHITVHHTNEVAQSEAFLGHEWGKYWLHGAFLINDTGKMSKSKDGFLTLTKLEQEGFHALDYRYFCLQARYNKQLLFRFDSLKEAQNAYRKLLQKISDIKALDDGVYDEDKIGLYEGQFMDYINDDLNTPNALTVVWEVLKAEGLQSGEKMELFRRFDQVLSLNLYDGQLCADAPTISPALETYIAQMIEKRNQARKEKNWALADEVRDLLLEKNISLKDSREGTTWEIIS